MKKTKLLIAALIINSAFLILNCSAQTFPYGINYQAVARDANGNVPPVNTSEPIRFTIYKTSSTGSIVWQETQTQTTNSMGQFNAIIGTGVRQPASTLTNFNDIAWNTDSYFLKVELQTGISTFVQIGITTQFQSVPYALAAPDPTPAGSIIAYGGISAPPGYLLCRGQAVARPTGSPGNYVGTYAKLFTVIGTYYGNGDGSSTFNVPDFRGMFLRGMDSTAVNDPDAATRTSLNGGNSGAKVGSYEVDELKSHTHPMTGSFTGVAAGSGTAFGTFSTSNTLAAGGNETRPKNIYVNYIIKY